MIIAAIVAAGLLAGSWFTSRLRRLPDAVCGDPLPTISVVVPARDEAASLPTLLASLATSAEHVHEVIVVDDASTDSTADVAESFGATVVRVDGPPSGWAGKPHACARGAELATGDVLLFLDADVRLLPGVMPRLAAARAKAGGLLSVQPYHRVERRYEELSAMFNAVSLIGSGAFAPWPAPRRPVAFGPCLMTSANDYRIAGGHATVSAAVVDDIALARSYRRAALPVTCYVGRGAVEFRMYPSGVRQLVEGWTKNIAAGAGATDIAGLIAGVMFVAACAASAAAACNLVLRVGSADRPAIVAAVATWAAVAIVVRSILWRIGSFRWATAIVHPVATGAFILIFVRSLWSTVVRRQVRWRGRVVRVGRSD
jgi:4,4'-diaponeurosporenoate glycosyltransferase